MRAYAATSALVPSIKAAASSVASSVCIIQHTSLGPWHAHHTTFLHSALGASAALNTIFRHQTPATRLDQNTWALAILHRILLHVGLPCAPNLDAGELRSLYLVLVDQ